MYSYYVSDFRCPKCGGVDYYFSNRTVMKGIGGIWGNRGGVKKFAVCKVCEEIMDSTIKKVPVAEKPEFKFIGIVVVGFFLLYFILFLFSG